MKIKLISSTINGEDCFLVCSKETKTLIRKYTRTQKIKRILNAKDNSK